MLHRSALPNIRSFLVVAKTLNFRRAAEHLGIAQPALSRSVKQLEQQLGFRLFDRSTRRVALTPAGDLLLREGGDAMQLLLRACQRAERTSKGLSGKILIGYSTFASAGPMAEIIIEFRKIYPEATVGLRLLASSEQAAELAEGSLDFGFMMVKGSEPSFARIPVSRERLVALFPTSNKWAKRRSVTLAELALEPMVLGTHSRWQGFRSLLNDVTATRSISFKVVEEADDLPVLLQLVRSGFGCTILDTSFEPTLPPGICAVEIGDLDATLEVDVMWRPENLSIIGQRFIEVARNVVAGGTSSKGTPQSAKRGLRS
jgi:DNA-binding transcriptional LysR family regulator